jgi:hypothetical protein
VRLYNGPLERRGVTSVGGHAPGVLACHPERAEREKDLVSQCKMCPCPESRFFAAARLRMKDSLCMSSRAEREKDPHDDAVNVKFPATRRAGSLQHFKVRRTLEVRRTLMPGVQRRFMKRRYSPWYCPSHIYRRDCWRSLSRARSRGSE